MPLVMYFLVAVCGFSLWPATARAANSDDGFLVLFGIILVLFAILFVLPTFIAFRKRHPNRYIILVINVVFGCTLLGWLIALVWACKAVHLSAAPDHSSGGESGLNLFVNDEKKVRIANASASQEDRLSSLERLKRLHDSGAIDAAEYDRLKADILAKL